MSFNWLTRVMIMAFTSFVAVLGLSVCLPNIADETHFACGLSKKALNTLPSLRSKLRWKAFHNGWKEGGTLGGRFARGARAVATGAVATGGAEATGL